MADLRNGGPPEWRTQIEFVTTVEFDIIETNASTSNVALCAVTEMLCR